MNNVIAFPNSQTATDPAQRREDRPRSYFVTDVQLAVSVAAYLYADLEAADLLMAEIQAMYRIGKRITCLSEETRTRCGRYLRPDKETIEKTFEILYRGGVSDILTSKRGQPTPSKPR